MTQMRSSNRLLLHPLHGHGLWLLVHYGRDIGVLQLVLVGLEAKP